MLFFKDGRMIVSLIRTVQQWYPSSGWDILLFKVSLVSKLVNQMKHAGLRAPIYGQIFAGNIT
jgi:hypothetical protein